jgi:hypothetical protein
MSGMRCDRCERLFTYGEQIVALHQEAGSRSADLATEGEGGTLREGVDAEGKYHLDCYEALRAESPTEWPAVSELNEL